MKPGNSGVYWGGAAGGFQREGILVSFVSRAAARVKSTYEWIDGAAPRVHHSRSSISPGRPVPKGLKQTKQKWPAQSYATMICTNGQRAIRSAKETILELPGRQLDDGCGTVLGRSR